MIDRNILEQLKREHRKLYNRLCKVVSSDNPPGPYFTMADVKLTQEEMNICRDKRVINLNHDTGYYFWSFVTQFVQYGAPADKVNPYPPQRS